ncbi:uncharacterized protein LOC128224943 [Mya arenaria]|uniref:uncharacterized protein LOC128224943 n=1 Tax=Mya arenaria TaxID=6604 RepID=UPI0022DF39D0|nr:uncharacterized protein LOC128224943 [Mya arenaria]
MDGSLFLQWMATSAYNGSSFFAECSTNGTIKTPMTYLNMKDIDGPCGAFVILSPVVRGAEVELGYFPSDQSLQRKTFTKRTWKKDMQNLQLREGSHKEELLSEYLYILIIFDFKESDKGTYSLYCNSGAYTDSVQLHISERPSYPVLGPKFPDFNTTECIHVYVGSDLYCKTENGTEPVQVSLLNGQDSFDLAGSKGNKSLYRLKKVHQQMAGLSRRKVTCQVSNAALEKPYEVHGNLCSVEKGSLPVLTVPEQLHGETSTSICEVRNVFPALAIEIRIDKVLQADVEQINIFNGSSYTFTSIATMTKAHKTWNGKQMCCTLTPKYDFGLESVSVCKNINMQYLFMETAIVKESSPLILNLTCQSGGPFTPCSIAWSSNSVYLYPISTSQWTKNSTSGYISVSNALYFITKDVDGKRIQCYAKCENDSSDSKHETYTISIKAFQ